MKKTRISNQEELKVTLRQIEQNRIQEEVRCALKEAADKGAKMALETINQSCSYGN